MATGGGLGAETVILPPALLPSLLAVIVAVPAPMAETRPLEETSATSGASVLHTTVRSVSTKPRVSLAVAVSCAVWPTSSVRPAPPRSTLATAARFTTQVALSRRLAAESAASSRRIA